MIVGIRGVASGESAAQDVQSAISVAGKTLPQAMTIPPTYRKVNPADPPIMILGARSANLAANQN
jgi:HAE1 family hydrophobic/amphiphilic exporter-1